MKTQNSKDTRILMMQVNTELSQGTDYWNTRKLRTIAEISGHNFGNLIAGYEQQLSVIRCVGAGVRTDVKISLKNLLNSFKPFLGRRKYFLAKCLVSN